MILLCLQSLGHKQFSDKLQWHSFPIIHDVLFFSLKVSFIQCTVTLQCEKCPKETITVINGPGECNTCWSCPVCGEGHGSSVECEAEVPPGTQIHCVECIRGVNFSASFGFERCQPCGMCVGKHQRVLSECAPDRNIRCECEDGYYYNETAGECVPCASCCSVEGKIREECSGESGKIRRKCKLRGRMPQICKSLLTRTPTHPSRVTSMASPEVLNIKRSKPWEDIVNPYKDYTPKTDWLWLFVAIASVVLYIGVTIIYFR